MATVQPGVTDEGRTNILFTSVKWGDYFIPVDVADFPLNDSAVLSDYSTSDGESDDDSHSGKFTSESTSHFFFTQGSKKLEQTLLLSTVAYIESTRRFTADALTRFPNERCLIRPEQPEPREWGFGTTIDYTYDAAPPRRRIFYDRHRRLFAKSVFNVRTFLTKRGKLEQSNLLEEALFSCLPKWYGQHHEIHASGKQCMCTSQYDMYYGRERCYAKLLRTMLLLTNDSANACDTKRRTLYSEQVPQTLRVLAKKTKKAAESKRVNVVLSLTRRQYGWPPQESNLQRLEWYYNNYSVERQHSLRSLTLELSYLKFIELF